MKKQALVKTLKYVGLGLLVYLSLVGVGALFSPPPAKDKEQVASASIPQFDDTVSIVQLMNEERAKVGLKPFTEDAELKNSASIKFADMVANHYWDHVSPTGVTPFQIIMSTTRFKNDVGLGENLAECQLTTRDVVAQWVASPGHYKIMTTNYKYVGVYTGYDEDRDCYVTVAHFAENHVSKP